MDNTPWRQSVVRFIPEQAAIDGVQVPFTFEEEGQVSESVTSLTLDPGRYSFELISSVDTSQPFPTLTVQFETL